jgi:hypothetical protein
MILHLNTNAFRNVHENQVELKLNGIYQLLVYSDDVNLLGDNIYTVKKNTETLIDASKEVGLEGPGSKYVPVTGCWEHGNDRSGFKKCLEVLTK